MANNKNQDRDFLNWLAGFIGGEGCFTIVFFIGLFARLARVGWVKALIYQGIYPVSIPGGRVWG